MLMSDKFVYNFSRFVDFTKCHFGPQAHLQTVIKMFIRKKDQIDVGDDCIDLRAWV